jgi:hypothetical protein
MRIGDKCPSSTEESRAFDIEESKEDEAEVKEGGCEPGASETVNRDRIVTCDIF